MTLCNEIAEITTITPSHPWWRLFIDFLCEIQLKQMIVKFAF